MAVRRGRVQVMVEVKASQICRRRGRPLGSRSPLRWLPSAGTPAILAA